MNRIIDEKLMKFISVGLINTLAGMVIMFGMYNLFGCSYWLSSATNYLLVSILSYALNRSFTFNYKGKIITSGIRFATNILACYIVAYGIAKPLAIRILAECNTATQENVAMFIGMCLFTGLNYIGQRLFVFRE